MKLADALIQALVDHGVQQAFGIPGDFALPLFDAIENPPDCTLHTLSHEPVRRACRRRRCAHASAASAWSRRLTYGAGALDLVNPIACGLRREVPGGRAFGSARRA